MASLADDPRFQRNRQQLQTRATRILEGVPVPQGELIDCVAVGCDRGWKCTGVLVAPNVVLTAAHCSSCAQFVFFGGDVRPVRPADTSHPSVVAVQSATPHAAATPGGPNDIMLLVLAKSVNVAPRRVASSAVIDAATDARVAGFGWVDPRGRQQHGEKRMVDVPIASNACDGSVNGRSDADVYGCAVSLELVAKPKDKLVRADTCRGDSGGPLYIQDPSGEWLLAALTSRGVRTSGPLCGDGGIYTRVDAQRSWIAQIANVTL